MRRGTARKSVMKGTRGNRFLQFLIFSNLDHSSQTHASLVGVIIVAKRADHACRLVAMNLTCCQGALYARVGTEYRMHAARLDGG